MASTKRKSLTKPAAASIGGVAAPAKPPKSSRKHPQKWQLQTAKAKFSEVFRRARTEGPQHVSKAGKEEVVVLAKEEFDRMTRRNEQPESLAEFLMNSPLAGSGITIERQKDYPRKIEL